MVDWTRQRSYDPDSRPNWDVVLYDNFTLRPNNLSKEEINEFNNRPASIKDRKNRDQVPGLDMIESCKFPSPQVYMDLEIQGYLLKCRFFTKVLPRIKKYEWEQNWIQELTLVIDTIETTRKQLLTWHCGCS